MLIFAAGVGAILLARMLFEEDLRLEIPAMVSGAILIASAHAVNRRMSASCVRC